MKERKVIIRRDDGKFAGYPACGWIDEYPGAIIFDSVMAADRFFTQHKTKYPADGLMICAVENYGFDTQQETPLNLFSIKRHPLSYPTGDNYKWAHK